MLTRRHVVAAGAACTVAGPVLALERAVDPPTELAPPSREAMRRLAGIRLTVYEVGSGDGYWLRAMARAGVDCRGGWDIHPRGAAVTHGDHLQAALAADGQPAALLAVWPPDGDEVQRWISVEDWAAVVLVGYPGRFEVGATLDEYRLALEIELPPGIKGTNLMQVWRSA